MSQQRSQDKKRTRYYESQTLKQEKGARARKRTLQIHIYSNLCLLFFNIPTYQNGQFI